ncbi:four-helix bundle copper-binding protein [Anaerotignum sp.]|uniref:four-helix bundle copper-binding protein n=1 Tax=Anaerotignum sp. TaxID=2039241 RepID=UPI0028A5AC84|nr:four-helix bundle copper-binding protein [Anaerotignum sp.]
MGVVVTTTDKFQVCIDACVKCTQACYECFDACLKESDLVKRKLCIATLMECAMTCQMSVAFMSMNREKAYDLCELCGKICANCAQVCADMEGEYSKKCAEICKMCSDECIKISSM